jgi:thermitase
MRRDTSPQKAALIGRRDASIVGLAVRGYRCRALQQVDLFWSGPRAARFDVHRDGQRIATVAATGYTDRIGRLGSGSYRYSARELVTGLCSNEAAVTFAGAR